MKWIGKLRRAIEKEPEQNVKPPMEFDTPQPLPLSHSNHERLGTLTNREREVFTLLVQGKKMQEAADMLGVKLTTISFHSTALYKKLDVHNRAQLILRYGLAQSIQDPADIRKVDNH